MTAPDYSSENETPPAGLSRRTWCFGLVAVYAVAVVLRLWCLMDFRQVPFSTVLVVDSAAYDSWATRIASGHWTDVHPFYQAPLYPYFLAVLYSLFGHNLVWVRIVQCMIGAGGAVLMAVAGRILYSATAGLAAGLVLALYAPAIFFDCLIQKSVLDDFLLPLFLVSIAAFYVRPSFRRGILAGAGGGLLTLSRENALFLLPVLSIWFLFQACSHDSPKRQWKQTAGFAAGFILLLIPTIVYNATRGAPGAITTWQAGPNFYIGNGNIATGSYVPLVPFRGSTEFEETDARNLAEAAMGRKLAPMEISRYWLGRTVHEITEHPAHWFRLLLRKSALTFNRIESVDTDDIYFYESFSPLLRAMNSVINFGLLFPLAIFGFVLGLRARRDSTVMIALVAGTMVAGLVGFYIVARYRQALALSFFLPAGAGLVWWRTELHHSSRRFCVAILSAALAAAFAWYPLISRDSQLGISYFNAAGAEVTLGHPAAAAQYYQLAIRAGRNDAATHLNFANLLAGMHRYEEAEAQFEQATQANAEPAKLLQGRGNMLLLEGRFDSALQEFQKAREAGGPEASLLNNEAVVLLKTSRLEEAREKLTKALKLAPEDVNAKKNLERVNTAIQNQPTSATRTPTSSFHNDISTPESR